MRVQVLVKGIELREVVGDEAADLPGLAAGVGSRIVRSTGPGGAGG